MYKDRMKLKHVSPEAQTMIKSLGIVEAQFSSYYDDYMDAQIERLDDERPTVSFEAFLKVRLMARQFIIRMAV
jgi:hypothetical protein